MLFASERTHGRTDRQIFSPDSGISSHSFGRSYNQSDDVVSRRGRTWRIVHQCQNGRLNASDTRGTGSPTTAYSHPNRQLDRTCTSHQQNPTKGVKSHGHAIPLVTMPRHIGPVSILLEDGNAELS
jgi:hypothetical protein